MSDTYKIYAVCQNCCGKLEVVEIPKGTESKRHLREIICLICGVKGRYALHTGVNVEEGE